MDRPAKRHGFRRFFAFAADFAIVWMLIAFTVTVAGWDDYDKLIDQPERKSTVRFSLGTQIAPPLSFGTNTCGSPLIALGGLEASVAPARVTGAEICIRRSFGMIREGTITLALDREIKVPIGSTNSVSFPLTFYNGPLEYLDLVVLAGLFVLGAGGTILFGLTPGKALFGLRIAGDFRRRGLIRESVRLLPLLAYPVPGALAVTFPQAFPLGSTPFVAVQVAALILGVALMLWLWIVPLFRWRGALGHDRAAGLRVVRLGEWPG